MVKKRAKEEKIKLTVIFVGTVKRLKKKKKKTRFQEREVENRKYSFLKKNIMC